MNKNGKIVPEPYDFDYKPDGSMFRNIETRIGRIKAGVTVFGGKVSGNRGFQMEYFNKPKRIIEVHR